MKPGRIFFTGGGTAGHVTPNLALIEHLTGDTASFDRGWEIFYIGSEAGIERSLTVAMKLTYCAIATGKLRRYFSWQNFLDPFLILYGFLQSIYLCLKYKPEVVFSKGGFVAVPLVLAAWCCRIPIICHESDITPGLANRICFPLVKYICVNFFQTRQFLQVAQRAKVRVTGSPLSVNLVQGDAHQGRQFLGFDQSRPILLILGGSLGAQAINACIYDSLESLLRLYQVVHITGANNVDASQLHPGYVQLEYIQAEFGHVLAAADRVLSRAGANSIYEILYCRKPNILVPLPAYASRGDQLENAAIFAGQGMSLVIQQESLGRTTLLDGLAQLEQQQAKIVAALDKFERKGAVREIIQLIHMAAE
ncbi:MAG: undecaprenyldiphospho-muramoylpentapeptide beta-N-acetylglucosaminyltransferase [Pseudomonadales bacterium]|nr:undecaprenyldiphospho-muramoylpentapeptide beta-N-acetylglucosaminyltransferase [Pseudomonadales bacterium]